MDKIQSHPGVTITLLRFLVTKGKYNVLHYLDLWFGTDDVLQ